MKKEKLLALFALSDIPVLNTWELPNQYWPDVDEYAEIRKQNPWWLVKTPVGLIQIGWRKRVISINWSDTAIHAIITEDDVTKSQEMVHAYSEEKAIQYLKVLSTHIWSYIK